MSSEWQSVFLSEIANYSQGIQVVPEEQFLEPTSDSGRFVRIIDYTNPSEPVRYIKNPGARYYVKSDDIVMIRYGSQTAGKVVRGISGFIANNLFKVNLKSSAVDAGFLYRILNSKNVFDYLRGSQSSSTMPAITFGMMDRIEFRYPSIEEQRAISAFFDTIDNRIALLRETNTTLEAIAQALFKSWFVDFDPVHANAGTQAPSLPPEIQALFPSTFTVSPQGSIPEGWSVGTLSELAEFQNGYAFKSKDWTDSGHPVVKIGDVKPGIIDFSGCSYVAPETVAGLERFRLNRGDLLVGMTGYVGETGLVPSVEPSGYVNQRVGRFFTPNGLYDCGFVYCLVRNHEFKAYAEAQSHGSAQANVSGSALQAYPCIIPTAEVLGLFNLNVYPLLDSILSHHEQAQTLANLRDTLLPRLISGQLRLPEAEAALAEVG